MCECEECLALRAVADDLGSGETVAAFEHDGSTYEIDHLGIGSGSQWGEFVVYCDDEEVAEFTLAESGPRPGPRPGSRPAELPVSADELIWLARQALSGGPAGMIRLGACHLARARYASVRFPERYAQPGPEASSRHLAATGPSAR